MLLPEDTRKTTDTADPLHKETPAYSDESCIGKNANSSISSRDHVCSKQDALDSSTVLCKDLEYDPSIVNRSNTWVISVKTARAVMEGLFSGLVIQGADGDTPARASRYLEVDPSDEFFGGDAQKVIEEAVKQVQNLPRIHRLSTEAQLREEAQRLAISCGKISITWQHGNSTETSGLSGFWIDHHGKYFVTALHFLDQMRLQLKISGQKVVVFQKESECHVNSNLRGEIQSKTIQVKLKAWEWTSDTAIFEPIDQNAVVSCSVCLSDIGHFKPQSKQQVFTVGYCGEDYPVTLEEVLANGKADNVSEDGIRDIHQRLQLRGGPREQEVTKFQFLKEYYRVKLSSYPLSLKDRQKEDCLGKEKLEFKDIFRPNRRAAAAGYMGMWDPRTAERTNGTYTFGQMTDISLFHGLSGSPVIGLVDQHWQIIAKVRGGRFDALYNDLTAFKPAYGKLIADLIEG